jgi:dGTPase
MADSKTVTVREEIESREAAFLRPCATRSADSRGRIEAEPEDPWRTRFQRDRDRILHTKAFRRLKRKTQVFLAPKGDHYRTRLTHTLEVSQIARTVARALFLNEDLAEAIALGHDLGHTPFGHAGERVLDCFSETGFHHADQSLRVVDLLEKRSEGRGLNLTYEVRDGIQHHSRGKALLQGGKVDAPSTFEGVIVSICDAIAYISHDIDDALRARIITIDDLPAAAVRVLGTGTSGRIDTMVTGLIEESSGGEPGVRPDVLDAMNTLRDYLYNTLYPSPPIHDEIRRAEDMLEKLCNYLSEYPPDDLPLALPGDSPNRRITDFVAGMTDEFALALYRDLLMPARWTR